MTWIARFVIPLLFVASGAAALALELVWSRWLTHAVGSSTYATTIVLATFMGGIGIGSWLAGQSADRNPSRCLRWFAFAELAIGVWSLLSIALVAQVLPSLAAGLARLLGLDTLPVVMRVGLAVLALLPPTVLMGATLPWMVRWASWTGMLPARGVGLLYVANTLGGVVGILAATFWLIEKVGLARTVMLAGLVDGTIGVVAFLLWRSAAEAPERELESLAPPHDAGGSARNVMLGVTLGYFVSGFVGLGLEITTHRILAILAGSSVYAFAVMLAAFLLGIAAGGALAAAFAATRWNPALLLGLTLGGLAVGAGLSVRLANMSGWGVAGGIGRKIPLLANWSYAFELVGYLVILLPATLMLGAAVPLVGRVAAAQGRLGRGFGTAYAWNTLGAVLGAAVVGTALIPWLGSARSALLLTCAAGLGGLAVIVTTVPASRRIPPLIAVTLLLLIGILLNWGVDPVRDNLAQLSQQVSGQKREVFFREGPVQTVTVLHVDQERSLEHYRVITNRVSLTATVLYSRRYMGLLGHLPVLWSRTPRLALIIGFGTGITSSAVVSHAELDGVTIAEISPEIRDASYLFSEVNRSVLSDPRVRFELEDGRHLLLASDQPWDVITLEPPPPRESGVVSLYTTDFYELCRQRLAPGGVVAQWIPLHSQSRDETWMLIRSFVEAMPHVLGFLPVQRELILLGSSEPLETNLELLRQKMAGEAVASSLAAIGFTDPLDLLASATADRGALESLTAAVPSISDDRPHVEYFARYGKIPRLPIVDGLAQTPPPLEALVQGPISASERQRFDVARQALLASLQAGWHREFRRVDQAEQLTDRAVDLRPDDAYYLWAAELSDEHIRRLVARAQADASDLQTWTNLGVKLARRAEYGRALDALRRARDLAPENPEVVLRLGLVLIRDPAADRAETDAVLRRFLALAPDHPRAEPIRSYLVENRLPD